MGGSIYGVRTMRASGTAASQISNCNSVGKLAKSGNSVSGAVVDETSCSDELARLASLADILRMLREADETFMLVLRSDFLNLKDLAAMSWVYLCCGEGYEKGKEGVTLLLTRAKFKRGNSHSIGSKALLP